MGPTLAGAPSQAPTAQSRQFDKKTITLIRMIRRAGGDA
jgi:hypothetical protein